MKSKLKPDLDLESVQDDLIEAVCSSYQPGVSVRALAKKFELSPMKTRKILITGGVYSTDLSTEIDALWKDGKTAAEIAVLLGTTVANVNSYLPYEKIVYNMDEKSVEADRQARYREKLRAGVEKVEKEKPVIERIRNKTMIIVIGKKLRKYLPVGVLDDYSDPLARVTWSQEDPDKNIWCAEITVAGRGKAKKSGIVLESANCGFAVICPMIPLPEMKAVDEIEDWSERREADNENREIISEYRAELETVMLNSIRKGLLDFKLPEERVLDYVDTVGRVELIKGRPSMPQVRVEEFIKQELDWESGDDPVAQFNVRGNWTSRKFGFSGEYRHVDAAVQQMLGMNGEESWKWMTDFLAPAMEKMRR